VIARTVLRARTGWLRDEPLKHRARSAVWASTGLLQDKQLKHRARPAALASTGWKQEDPLRHPARSVPRTRTRLLRAVLEPHALAMQATVGTPAQGIAQRAYQASGNQQEAMVIARTVLRASTGWLRDEPLKHRARSAAWASTGLLQDKQLKHRARSAAMASTGWKQEDPLRHPARSVPRTRTRLLRAVLEPHALAMQATVGTPAQGIAQRV
jgi:hypothetical protein